MPAGGPARRQAIRLMITLALERVYEPRFDTAEMFTAMRQMHADGRYSPKASGIPSAATTLKRVGDLSSLGQFMRGHPLLERHPDGVTNNKAGDGSRQRVQLWRVRQK
ncbi:MAG: hypothetical protein [Circular genetic element sp.]|nr:MAG: hypothetical protein [Circular genetic element sp.]